jgi:pimeloyl-ACP methyl ester carboxylesterase
MESVRVDGDAIVAYEEHGEGPPVVLLHGVPGTARHMRMLARHLRRDHRVIAFDLPGFGSSTPLDDPTLEHHADRVLAAMASMGLEEVRLVGHSIGAVVAAAVALQGPYQVESLSLLACIGARPHDSLRNSGIPFQDLAERFDGPDREAALDEAEAHFQRIQFTGMTRGECEQAIRFIHLLDFAAVPEMLQRLSVPTMVAFADDDASIEPEIRDVLRRWAPPGLRLRWPTGGHSIQRTRAREIADGLRSMV